MDIHITEITIRELITKCKNELYSIETLHSKENITKFYTSIISQELPNVTYKLRNRSVVKIDNDTYKTVLNNKFLICIDNYTELFNICNIFYEENKENKENINIQLNNDFYDISCEFLSVLFEYSFIYKFIWMYLKKHQNPNSTDFYIKLYNNNNINKLKDNVKIKEILNNHDQVFNEELLTHLWISFNFNQNILNVIKYFNIMNNNKIIDRQLHSISIIDEQIQTFNNIHNFDLTISYIKKILKTCSQLNYNQLRDYITIPQYNYDCWFITMLTCICYSDKSKNLILNKLETNKDNILLSIDNINSVVSTKTDIDKQFITFIYYIILNITHNHATYSTFERVNNQKLCEIANYLKTYPEKYLNDMFTLYKSNYPKTDNIFESICNETIFWLTTITDDGPECNPANTGCDSISHSIITSFYSILNIKSIYIYHTKIDNTNKYYIPLSIIDNISNYDIFIVAKNLNLNCKNLHIDFLRDITDDYNALISNYEIDYVVQGNKHDLSHNDDGHDISCITYNGIEYIHDSSTQFNHITCSEKKYIKPCTLIPANWKTFITKLQFTYLIRPCYFKEFNDIYEDESIMREYLSSTKDIDENNTIFVTNNNIIIAYIKKSAAILDSTINSLIPTLLPI
jgi:hypothetical protein